MNTKLILSATGIGCLSLLLAACGPDEEKASTTPAEPTVQESVKDELQESVDEVVEKAEELAEEAKEMASDAKVKAEEAAAEAVEASQAAVDDAVNKIQQEMSGSDASMPTEADEGDEKVDDMKKKLESELKLP